MDELEAHPLCRNHRRTCGLLLMKIVPYLHVKLVALVVACVREMIGEATSCAMTLKAGLVSFEARNPPIQNSTI
jgi:hypothetical protein